jgi:hypothetical protein
MTRQVVSLGAGFGGLELSTLLSERLADEVEVTLIDQNDAFTLGFTTLGHSSSVIRYERLCSCPIGAWRSGGRPSGTLGTIPETLALHHDRIHHQDALPTSLSVNAKLSSRRHQLRCCPEGGALGTWHRTSKAASLSSRVDSNAGRRWKMRK